MNTEQVVRHLHDELAAVPQAHSSFEAIARRGRRRRLVRRSAMAATALAVMAMTLVTVARLAPSGPRFLEATADEPARVLIDGDVALPVGDTYVVTDFRGDTLTVYRGLRAATPQFDPSVLGEEHPLVSAQPQWASNQTVGGVSSVVYIGDVNGRSVYVHTNTFGLLERIQSWFKGETIGDHICLGVGDMTTIGGGGFCTGGTRPDGQGVISDGYLVRIPNGGLFSAYLTWIDVPDNTSVVSVELDDGRRLWQQPAGATTFFELGPYDGAAVITAFDSTGEILIEEDRQVHRYQQVLDGISNKDPSN